MTLRPRKGRVKRAPSWKRFVEIAREELGRVGVLEGLVTPEEIVIRAIGLMMHYEVGPRRAVRVAIDCVCFGAFRHRPFRSFSWLKYWEVCGRAGLEGL